MAEKQIRYGAGGKVYYKDVEESVEPKKEEVLSEILTENPNKKEAPKEEVEHTHEDGTTHKHEGGDQEHTHEDEENK